MAEMKNVNNNNWYRRITWSANDAKEFEARLSRSRSQRAQYLKIQAWTLAETGDPTLMDPSIQLANRYLQEDPDGVFTVQAYLIIAKAHATKRDVTGAINAYRKAVKAEARIRGVRSNAYLAFAWFVVTQDLKGAFEEALEAMESMQKTDLIFPINQYKYFGSLALISDYQGDRDLACRMAKNALRAMQQTAGPFSRHKDVGLVDGVEENIQRRIWRLAI
jgi:hypothetical protein